MNLPILSAVLALISAPVENESRVIPHDPSMALTNGVVEVSFTLTSTNGVSGLLSKDAYGYGEGGHLSIWTDNGIVHVRHQTAASSHRLQATNAVAAAVTNTVRYVFDGALTTLSVNGVTNATAVSAVSLADNSEPLVIGGRCLTCSAGLADRPADTIKGVIHSVSIATPRDPEPPKEMPAELKGYFKNRLVSLRVQAPFEVQSVTVSKDGRSVTRTNKAVVAARAMRSMSIPPTPPKLLKDVDLRFRPAITVEDGEVTDTLVDLVTQIRKELEPFGGRITAVHAHIDGTIDHVVIDTPMLYGLKALAESTGMSENLGAVPHHNDEDQNRFWKLHGEDLERHRRAARTQLATTYRTWKLRTIQYVDR